MQETVLSINNLSIAFTTAGTSVPAVAHLTLQVKKGELLAIVGESGSGKSVTALSVLRLIPEPPACYQNGEILFHNNGETTSILKASAEKLRDIRGKNISMIFQEPMTSLNPVKTCGAQVQEALTVHYKISKQEAKQKTLNIFSQVLLPEPETVYNKYPHQLSGGQKQRVMIAMAMVCEPSLLICDEPTTALDVTVQQSILRLIKTLQQKNNMGVIFISHDLAVVAEIADTIAVMYKGKLVEYGDAKKLLANPAHPYTKALLACRPAVHLPTERLPVVSDFIELNATGEIIEKKPTEPIKIIKPRPENNIVLSVNNLTVQYPGKKNIFGTAGSFTKAIDNISFEVFKGETLGLVGESGCGKTTLGRTILGLIQPTSGNVMYLGKNVHEQDRNHFLALRKKMQLIFQDPYSSLNPTKKIGYAITEPLEVHSMHENAATRKEAVIHLLEKVNLSADYFNRYPHELSGGQRQRIVIARALALEPEFIVCDESVSALDVSVQAQVLNLLNDLKKEFGFTAIFISHDMSVIRYISDRIMVMHQGKIEEIGNAEQIYHHPKSAYTQKLLDAVAR